MSDWPIGLSTGCFYQTNILDCLEPIRHAGFGMIEVCSFPAHLDYHETRAVRQAADRIRDVGLEPYSFHAPFAEHIDITAIDTNGRQMALTEIRRAADAAAELGARNFVIHPGPEKGGFPAAEQIKRLGHAAAAMNEVHKHCREIGVRLVMENMLPHLLSGHVRDLLWILGSMEMTDVGVCLDTGHAHLSGDLQSVVHKLSGHLWMVHASDNRGRYDDHLPPGDGEIAWQPLLHQLSEVGFPGSIILEIAGNQEVDVTLAGARRGRTFLRESAK